MSASPLPSDDSAPLGKLRKDWKNGVKMLVTAKGFAVKWPAVDLVAGRKVQERRDFVAAKRKQAEEFARAKSAEIGREGSFGGLTARETVAAQEALRITDRAGVALPDAIAEWAEARKIAGPGADLRECARVFAESRAASGPVTLATAAEAMMRSKAARRAAIADGHLHLRTMRSEYAKICTVFGGLDVGALRAADVAGWLAELPLSPRMRNNLIRALRTLLNWCRRHGHLARSAPNIADALETFAEPRPDLRLYTAAELARLFAAAPEREVAALAILAFTGARVSEVADMEWGRIDLEEGTIRLRESKTSWRKFTFSPVLRPWLERVPLATRAGGLVAGPFPSNSREARHTRFGRRILEVFRAAGVEPVENGLRKTWISLRYQVLEDAHQVANEAGTSAKMIFAYYRHEGTKKAAAEWFAVTPEAVAVRDGHPENIVSFRTVA